MFYEEELVGTARRGQLQPANLQQEACLGDRRKAGERRLPGTDVVGANGCGRTTGQG